MHSFIVGGAVLSHQHKADEITLNVNKIF